MAARRAESKVSADSVEKDSTRPRSAVSDTMYFYGFGYLDVPAVAAKPISPVHHFAQMNGARGEFAVGGAIMNVTGGWLSDGDRL